MTSFMILSGVSGSGKTTAIRVFEDLGYFCVDNLPPNLFPTFIELCSDSHRRISLVALVMDVREGVFLEFAPKAIEDIRNRGLDFQILFLESSDEVLLRRYQETRRKHPLSDGGSVLSGITREREMLGPIKELSDQIIDTSSFNIHQLREILIDMYGKSVPRKLTLNLLSFGFKHGFPQDADIVMDVRFLPNPFYVEELKELTGMDKEVKEFIWNQSDTGKFMEKLVDILGFLIPIYEKEGKSYLTVALGCTGGVHRSIALVEELAERFKDLSPNVWHRDISRS